MDNRILILDEFTANQIAAGEVVERPSSVLKELMENSVDAGAGRIDITIKSGGIEYIKVSDNGYGIDKDDIAMAFERHGTSKIKCITDLNSISTMGFRGEALPSIASVSKVTVTTKTEKAKYAVKAVFEGGDLISSNEAPRATGTTVEVRNLFYNTPARYKFLKGDTSEARYCLDIVLRLALANNKVAFSFVSNGQEMLDTKGDGELINTIYSIYGRDIAKELLRVEYVSSDIQVKGYIGKPFAARGNRQHQNLFINGRYVKYPELNVAIERAYETMIMKGKFPFYVLDIKVKSELLDVNIHPAKTEIKISNINEVFKQLNYIVKNTLDENQDVFELSAVKPTYVQPSEVKDDRVKIQFDDKYAANEKTESYKPDQIKDQSKDVVVNTCVGSYIKPSESTPIKIDEIRIDEPYKIIGQIFNTYIFVDKFEYVYIIDQHAAHEKMNYEMLKKQFDSSSIISQQLMVPEQVVLTRLEFDYIEENKELIRNIGFDFSVFSANSIIVREIPVPLIDCNITDAFKSMIDDMMSDKKDRIYTALYSIACKASVKANKELDKEQMEYIYKGLIELDNPFTCPHGRPTMIKLTRYEFDKMFKRVV
ncbi:MAG: DNA mismatch repair endonuclease MutL [Clostridia bacterium]